MAKHPLSRCSVLGPLNAPLQRLVAHSVVMWEEHRKNWFRFGHKFYLPMVAILIVLFHKQNIYIIESENNCMVGILLFMYRNLMIFGKMIDEDLTKQFLCF